MYYVIINFENKLFVLRFDLTQTNNQFQIIFHGKLLWSVTVLLEYSTLIIYHVNIQYLKHSFWECMSNTFKHRWNMPEHSSDIFFWNQATMVDAVSLSGSFFIQTILNCIWTLTNRLFTLLRSSIFERKIRLKLRHWSFFINAN